MFLNSNKVSLRDSTTAFDQDRNTKASLLSKSSFSQTLNATEKNEVARSHHHDTTLGNIGQMSQLRKKMLERGAGSADVNMDTLLFMFKPYM